MGNRLRTTYITMVLLCTHIFAFSQQGFAIVNPKHQGKAYLYKNAISKIAIDTITNDSINEIYYCASIEKTTFNRALITTFTDGISMREIFGWIDWEELGVRLISDTIVLSKRPLANAEIVGTICMPAWEYIYPIRKAKHGWLYIFDFQKSTNGWVNPKYLCANPYTTCN